MAIDQWRCLDRKLHTKYTWSILPDRHLPNLPGHEESRKQLLHDPLIDAYGYVTAETGN